MQQRRTTARRQVRFRLHTDLSAALRTTFRRWVSRCRDHGRPVLVSIAVRKEQEMAEGPSARWGFIFYSVRNYMSDLTEHWHNDDVCLWKNEPGYVSTEFTFASPHFNRARDMYELTDQATALKAVLDGAMMLGVGALINAYEPFALGKIVDLRDQVRRIGPSFGNVLVDPFDPQQSSFPTGSRIITHDHYDPKNMIFQARQDPIALGVLKHLGFNGPDYRTLYSLLDWMESEGWTDERVAAVTNQNADVVKAFTGTANNATILGPLARHGEKRWQVPKSIMTLEDAQALILPASRAFLRSRAETFDATGTWPVHVRPAKKKVRTPKALRH